MMQRCALLVLVVLIGSITAANVYADTGSCVKEDPCTPRSALQAYLAAKKALPTRIAALDHVTNEWTGWSWDGKCLDDLPKGSFDIPATNDPTLLVQRGGRASIYLINTKPLLYATKQGAVTVTDISAIEDLKKVLSLFGGFISGAAQMRQQSLTATDLRTHALFEATDEADEFGRAVAEVITVLENEKVSIGKATDETVAASKELAKILAAVSTARETIAQQLQLIENEPKSFSRASLAAIRVTTSDLMKAQAELASKAETAKAVAARCPKTISSLRQALVWKIDGVPVTLFRSEGYRAAWSDVSAALVAASGECGDVGVHVQTVGRWLIVNPPSPRPADAATQTLFLPLFRASDDFVSLVAKRDGAVAKAAEATEKNTAVLKETVQVSNFVTDLDKYLKGVPDGDMADCLLVRGVAPIWELDYAHLVIGPTKVRNEEFTVTVRPAFSGQIERQLVDRSGKFHLKKTNVDLDFDTAVTYTRLYESTYKAVKAVETDTHFTIRETERKTRAGGLALFVTGRAQRRARGLGLQIGFGLDTANPSLYTGLAWRLGDYAKISVGETLQRVTKLTNGQFVGQSDLLTAEELATRDGWTSRPYIALSLTLDNLPIFSGK